MSVYFMSILRQFGIFLVYIWYIFGLFLVYIWYIFGIYLVYFWYIFGCIWNILRTSRVFYGHALYFLVIWNIFRLSFSPIKLKFLAGLHNLQSFITWL
jgi:hypothetical protein